MSEVSATDIGVVRVLPVGTPGIPPAVPYRPGGYGYDHALCCMAEVDAVHVPPTPDFRQYGDAYYCTRPEHGDDGPHVCFLRYPGNGEPACLIVWGGE